MIVNELIITGRYYRVLIDKTKKLWQRISYWTHSTDVEFEDGKNAEEKLGNINGITSNVELENEDMAASIKAVHQINSNLDEMKVSFQDGCNKIVGKITALGATVPEPTNDLDNIITGIQNVHDKAIARNTVQTKTSIGLTHDSKQATMSAFVKKGKLVLIVSDNPYRSGQSWTIGQWCKATINGVTVTVPTWINHDPDSENVYDTDWTKWLGQYTINYDQTIVVTVGRNGDCAVSHDYLTSVFVN